MCATTPSVWLRVQCLGRSGLVNIGNTCFTGGLFEFLASSKLLVEACHLDLADPGVVHDENKKKAVAFAELIIAIYDQNKRPTVDRLDLDTLLQYLRLQCLHRRVRSLLDTRFLDLRQQGASDLYYREFQPCVVTQLPRVAACLTGAYNYAEWCCKCYNDFSVDIPTFEEINLDIFGNDDVTVQDLVNASCSDGHLKHHSDGHFSHRGPFRKVWADNSRRCTHCGNVECIERSIHIRLAEVIVIFPRRIFRNINGRVHQYR